MPGKTVEATRADERQLDQGAVPGAGTEREASTPSLKEREIPVPERGRGAGIDLGLQYKGCLSAITQTSKILADIKTQEYIVSGGRHGYPAYRYEAEGAARGTQALPG